MYCSNCGSKLRNEDKFCSQCGFEVEEVETVEVEPVEEEPIEKKPIPKGSKVWDVFAIIGFVSGLATFVASLLTIFIGEIYLGIAISGIVFAALGKKSNKYRSKAKVGLGFAIAATAISATSLIFIF